MLEMRPGARETGGVNAAAARSTENPLFSEEYRILAALLVEMRVASGLSQRALARRLRRSQSHVHRIEIRQRRVELSEFCVICFALDVSPVDVLAEFLDRTSRIA